MKTGISTSCAAEIAAAEKKELAFKQAFAKLRSTTTITDEIKLAEHKAGLAPMAIEEADRVAHAQNEFSRETLRPRG